MSFCGHGMSVDCLYCISLPFCGRYVGMDCGWVLVNVKLKWVVGMLINTVVNLDYFTLNWTCVVVLHELSYD